MLDPAEPMNLAMAIAEMQLDYVVITSVDRDDVADGGASHFAECIRAARHAAPSTLIEVLIPDFRGEVANVAKIVQAGPEVIAQNIETVERLTHPVRDKRAGYKQTLDMLVAIKRLDPTRFTKSSIMVGIGETKEEVVQTMRDLREADVDFLTLGQYLRPSRKQLEVESFVTPETFADYERIGLELGFGYVASGPLVRSSYKAGEFFITRYIKERQAG
jgi:lipoic acid synthetase